MSRSECIHISDFCARVYRQHEQEQECGAPPSEATNYDDPEPAGHHPACGARNGLPCECTCAKLREQDVATNFDDAGAKVAWKNKWGTQTPVSHLQSFPPDGCEALIEGFDVDEGSDDKASPFDSVVAYIAEHACISLEDSLEYIYRAAHGCHWGRWKRVGGEVWPDITAIASTVTAHLKDDAMYEMVDWFVRVYPQKAAKMDISTPASAASKAGQGEAPPAEAELKQVAWSDDDAVYMPNKDAVALSKGKLSDSTLSRLLTPTGPMRYMRERQRCKVHIGDLVAHLRTMAGGLSDNELSDIAEQYLHDNEERKAAATTKKKAKKAGK